MRDILPEEEEYFRYLRNIFESACTGSGFQHVYTPTLESSNLFVKTVGKGTDIVEKEMYTFKDKSNNSVTMRPEGTASVARAYLENGMTS
jgi:histidyl-tRNA synthetase